jgi:hypothetical protein
MKYSSGHLVVRVRTGEFRFSMLSRDCEGSGPLHRRHIDVRIGVPVTTTSCAAALYASAAAAAAARTISD